MPSKNKVDQTKHACGFCGKVFSHERTLQVHMCSIKERDLARDEKYPRMGFRVFYRFFVFTTKKTKTWDEFIRSRYYNDFYRVGKYIVEINAVNTPQFIDFLIRSTLPIKQWIDPVVYETYVRELNKKENVEAAVERNILLMQQWASQTENHWTDFFRKVSPAQATMWIKAGRISPWVIYITDSAAGLFERMSPEQLNMVKGYLDPSFWEIKIRNHKEDTDRIRMILEEAGV
jgi:hypothetical protein